MARERAKLTEKEERILIQAQLMGLSTGSMVKIGNRLKAIEKDREDQARIDEDCQGYSWTKIAGGWSITNADGYVSEFTNQQKGKGSWYNTTYNYTIKVHKPGTRFKARTFKKKELRISDLWRARMCPAGSKQVYAMVRWCHGLKHQISISEKV